MSLGLRNKEYQVLENLVTREVFTVIATERKIRFDDLVRRMETRNVRLEQLLGELNTLESAGLVTVIQAPIPDLRIYYISQSGLAAERTML